MTTLKSIWAVLAGFVSVAILSIGTDIVLEGTGIFPPSSQPEAYVTWMLLVALIYRSIYSAVGGYLTSYLAPSHAHRHVAVLAILGLIGGVVGAVASWGFAPHWYCIGIAVTGPLAVLLGGRLRGQE